MLLPIGESDEIDYGRLAAEIHVLIEARPSGIYSNGTAGEFYNQTEAEFDRVSALLAERCNAAGMPFQIGVSHMSPRISLERLRRAAPLEPSAVQVILPDWFPPTDEEAIDFLDRIAEAADPIGLVLYNPGHAKRTLSAEEIVRLAAAAPGLVGVKVAGGDAAWYETVRQGAPCLSIFAPGHHLATHYGRGAHGSYSNVACLHPGVAQRWYEQMETDLGAALDVERRIQRFMNEEILPFITVGGYSHQAVDKLLAAIGAWADVGPRLRWPYRSIPEAEADRLRPIARRLLPEFFES